MNDTRKFSTSTLALGLVLFALLAAMGFALKNYLDLARLALAFPYPLDYGEGPLLDQAIRLIQGENIYHNIFSVPPYTISNYPPVFVLIQGLFSLLFGPAFWYGRALSLLCAVLTAVFLGLTLYSLTSDGLAAAIGGLLLLTFPYMQYWSLLFRIDLLALMFSWAAIWVSVRWGVDRRWGIPLAASLFVASIYTRQSYLLAGPVSVAGWLFLTGQRRKAIELALLTGGISLVLFLLINLLTRGGFYLNIVTANVNPFSWERARNNLILLLAHAYYLVAFILIFIILDRIKGHTGYGLLVLFYFLTATMSAVTIGKDGSNVNYLLELAAALCFAAGAGLAWMGRISWIRVVIVLAFALQVIMLNQWTELDFKGRILDKTGQEAQLARLAQEVRAADGIVLADEYMGLLPLAGKRIYFQPFEYKMLSEGGLWDQQGFLQEIQNHKFSTIFQYQPPNWDAIHVRWTPEMQAVIRASYAIDQTIAFTWIKTTRK
jgi:hypothetical protein